MRRIIIYFILMVLSIETMGNRPIKIQAERLPDLNVPRFGHAIFCTNGELTVAGGHTLGFIPTMTAEYLNDGKWHQVPTVYPHDFGISLVMKSGKVLLAGGCKDNLGSGQTFEAEMYDPASHSFMGFGCLAHKRTLGSAIELDSGQVMITGNWYSDDLIEIFDGKKFFTKAKDVTAGRLAPYLFRTSDNDVLILSERDIRGNSTDSIVIDRLHGNSFNVPLLNQWKPMMSSFAGHSHNCFIGDESKGKYAYLMTVSDIVRDAPDSERQGKPAGQLAIVLVEDTIFSLLPTSTPIPMTTDIASPIFYSPTILADQQLQYAYLCGYDKDKRLYIVRIEYAKRPAPLTLYYTDPLPDCGFGVPVLTDEGNLAIIGGCEQAGFQADYFQPVASAWLIRFNGNTKTDKGLSPWLLRGIVIILLSMLALLLFIYKKRHKKEEAIVHEGKLRANTQLMDRIVSLMDERQLFRNSELKPSDIATELCTNTRYVTDCIKACSDKTFSQFVNDYRINYVKQMLRQHPEKQLSEIYSDAGFASERSFFRAFKTATGMTTREWVNKEIEEL